MANILRFGLEANMQNRLTCVAAQELVSLLAVFQDFMPSTDQDARFLIGGLDLSIKHAYEVSLRYPEQDQNAGIIWNTRVPNIVKVFAWLLFRNRLNTRANLAHMHIINN